MSKLNASAPAWDPSKVAFATSPSSAPTAPRVDRHAAKHSLTAAAEPNDARLSKTAAKLFVGQLPFECNEKRLQELFGAYGTVEQIHILKDQDSRSKGAAFITYSSVEEADTAIFTLHNRYRMLTNRAIQVSYAKNSPNISPFGAQSAIEVHQLNRNNPVPDAAVQTSQPLRF